MNNFFLFLFSYIFFQLVSIKTYSQQGVNYNDVAVIVNMNSDSSKIIANYFMEKRHIPSVNLIPVYTSTNEEISDSLFKDYALQIKTYITNHDLGTSINYLVTTKGCPLKVLRVANDTTNCNSSCESELMLLPPNYYSNIGGCISNSQFQTSDYLKNPYFKSYDNFSRNLYGIYLVTRLDGYTFQYVLNMIDRSGPNKYVKKDSVLFVLDQARNFSGNFINNTLPVIANVLASRGWKVLLNTDSVYVTNQSKVLGYYSWGSNDDSAKHYTQNAIPHNTWVDGSIAETGVSTSGRSFQEGTAYGQSLIADLLKEGATGAKGYVYEPLDIAIAAPDILFDLYTSLQSDGAPIFNLAESYFNASLMIGWMDVVIGDPKTSITTNPAFASTITVNNNLSLHVFPNPAIDYIFIESKIKNADTVDMSLYDLMGKQVWNESADSACFLNKEINVSSLPSGVYTFQLRTSNQVVSMKIAVIR